MATFATGVAQSFLGLQWFCVPVNLRLFAMALLIIIMSIFALFTAVVASSKGHDYGPWATGGFLFGPIALVAACGLPDLKIYTCLGISHSERKTLSSLRSLSKNL